MTNLFVFIFFMILIASCDTSMPEPEKAQLMRVEYWESPWPFSDGTYASGWYVYPLSDNPDMIYYHVEVPLKTRCNGRYFLPAYMKGAHGFRAYEGDEVWATDHKGSPDQRIILSIPKPE